MVLVVSESDLDMLAKSGLSSGLTQPLVETRVYIPRILSAAHPRLRLIPFDKALNIFRSIKFGQAN